MNIMNLELTSKVAGGHQSGPTETIYFDPQQGNIIGWTITLMDLDTRSTYTLPGSFYSDTDTSNITKFDPIYQITPIYQI